MKTKKLKTYLLLAKRYWISTYTPEAVFSYTQEEADGFREDIIKYFEFTRKIICDTLDFKQDFSLGDLLHHLKNAERLQSPERINRINAVCTEITDEEYRCFAELICCMETDLSSVLENLKIYLVIRLWNSSYGVFDPKTDMLINHYLKYDSEFADQLAEICHRGVNNPGFCRWIINHWHLCCFYHITIKKELPTDCFLFREQEIIAQKIQAWE